MIFIKTIVQTILQSLIKIDKHKAKIDNHCMYTQIIIKIFFTFYKKNL